MPQEPRPNFLGLCWVAIVVQHQMDGKIGRNGQPRFPFSKDVAAWACEGGHHSTLRLSQRRSSPSEDSSILNFFSNQIPKDCICVETPLPGKWVLWLRFPCYEELVLGQFTRDYADLTKAESINKVYMLARGLRHSASLTRRTLLNKVSGACVGCDASDRRVP